MHQLIKKIEEAKYAVDMNVRNVAEWFYDALVDYIRKNPDELIPRSDGGFSVHAMNFWRNTLAENFGVVFMPRSGARKGGIGSAGRTTVLVLPVLLGPGNKKYLVSRINKNVVIHEMIHFLDPGYGKGGGKNRYEKKSGDIDYKKYYNDPAEWNAFWQEGANQWENILRMRYKEPKVISVLYGGGSLKGSLSKASMFWDEGFLNHMNKITKRKFDKRFVQLWNAARENGLL